MKNIEAILSDFGITIPDEKKNDLMKAVSENYVTVAEHEKKMNRLETDRDNWKSKAETAEATLKGFDGVDIDTMKSELETWKKKAEEAEEDAKKQLYERDFSDALKAELESIKFTSDAAKRAVMAEIKESGLKLSNGKILGLSDLIGQIKERDASAFVDEKQRQAQKSMARFTTTFAGTGTGGTYTKADFRRMSLDERIRLKESDPDLYGQLTQ